MHERGEPIAALWASEETIYGRFGYGLAVVGRRAEACRTSGTRSREPLEPGGQVRFVTPDEARELFPPIYDARARASGRAMPSRTRDVVGGPRTLRLARATRADAPRRFVVLELDGEPQAYAIYRTHFGFEGGLPASRLVVREALGATPQATAAIWRFLLDVDWMAVDRGAARCRPTIRSFLLLALPRRARYRMGDGLWVRLVDVGAALAGRAYGEGGPLVLEVRDAVCAWNDGRWKLDGGECARTETQPDLALDVSALGSAYLGAVSFTQLRDGATRRGAAARERSRARTRSSRGARCPWCPEIF